MRSAVLLTSDDDLYVWIKGFTFSDAGTDKFYLSLLESLAMMHVIDAVLDFRRSLATHNAIRAGGGEVIPT